jgi:hypothetical protein
MGKDQAFAHLEQSANLEGILVDDAHTVFATSNAKYSTY